jgi:hypothetical protein
MNESLLASAVAHWANAREFRKSLPGGLVDHHHGMRGPDSVECEMVKEIKADHEFGHAVAEVALGHPNPLVCAYALFALSRSHSPEFEAILRRFDDDARVVMVHIGSFHVPRPLSEVAKSISGYGKVFDEWKSS